MVAETLKREKKDFFRQVTLVAADMVTCKSLLK
jgi:hypothetical protein